MTSAWNEGYYEKSRRFFKSFYSNALKDNEYLQFAVVTGILRVVKEGIFSGLNNLSVYTVLDSDFSDGITAINLVMFKYTIRGAFLII